MTREKVIEHKFINRLHTIALFAGMILLLGALGLLFAGTQGLLLAGGTALVMLWMGQRISPRLILRMMNAAPLSERRAPGLYGMVTELARRAGLRATPRVYYIPSRRMNAFSVGSRKEAAIGVTDGLLRGLNQRELAGVLAHEITHVRYNDNRVLSLAAVVSRITGMFALLGQLLLFFNLPMLLLGMGTMNWLAILLLLAAPTLSGLLQLALTRTREFDADLGAAQLTGDPEALASALGRMERHEASLLRRVLLPGRRAPDTPLLSTHPATKKRIERLLELRSQERPRQPVATQDPLVVPVQAPRRPESSRWSTMGPRL